MAWRCMSIVLLVALQLTASTAQDLSSLSYLSNIPESAFTDPALSRLLPAEFETSGSVRLSTAAAKPPAPDDEEYLAVWRKRDLNKPFAKFFSQSIPKGLSVIDVNKPDAPPTFAFVGDAMAGLGFQWCDIYHYLEHSNKSSTLLPCAPRAGWADKVAGAYKDRVYMTHSMIRSGTNAKKISLPLVFNQFLANSQHKLKLIVLVLGSKYAMPNEELLTNLADMITTIRSQGIAVALMNRAPINTAAPEPLWFNNFNATAVHAMADAIRNLAVQQQVPLVDVWNAFISHGEGYKGLLGRDGVHFSPQGQEVVAKAFLAMVEQHMPDLSPHVLG